MNSPHPLRLRWLPVLALLLAAFTCSAEPYASPSNRFAVTYAAPWARITLPDPSAELSVLCDTAACGPTALLTFGAHFDSNLKDGKVAEFLKYAKGETILQNVRNAPGVSKVAILKEGRTKLGNAEAYEVLAELTLQNGKKRMRHTFMTFNAGYVYNVSLGCPPETHAKALANAQSVLASFKLK